MTIQGLVAELSGLPGKVADALKGASALAESNAKLTADLSALSAKLAEAEAKISTNDSEAARHKADADAALAAKVVAESEVAQLKAAALEVDAAAEVKAKAIVALQGTRPVNDRGNSDLGSASGGKVRVDAFGRPLSGLELAKAANAELYRTGK